MTTAEVFGLAVVGPGRKGLVVLELSCGGMAFISVFVVGGRGRLCSAVEARTVRSYEVGGGWWDVWRKRRIYGCCCLSVLMFSVCLFVLQGEAEEKSSEDGCCGRVN